MIVSSGIDLGGTKIEASVFAEDWRVIETRRVATPRNYEDLISALKDQVDWLHKVGRSDIPVGVGTPGRHDFDSGLALMANVPADGHPLRADLMLATGQNISFGNDCDLFAYSEAKLGAGRDFGCVFGLILGTGIGGGTCFEGVLHQTRNGTAGEVGHMPISAKLVAEFDLPTLTCGCGRLGCYETLGAGPGLARIGEMITGKPISAPEISVSDDEEARKVLEIWLAVVGEMIGILQLTIDPECIVLGGGLSNIPDAAAKISDVVSAHGLRGATPPVIVKAAFGDSSGTRGAALLALEEKIRND